MSGQQTAKINKGSIELATLCAEHSRMSSAISLDVMNGLSVPVVRLALTAQALVAHDTRTKRKLLPSSQMLSFDQSPTTLLSGRYNDSQ
jgi:hypothetical protein